MTQQGIQYVVMMEDEFASWIQRGDIWESNQNIVEDIRYFMHSETGREAHVLALAGDKVIGDVGVQKNPYNETELWLKYVSVHPEHRNKGIASALLDKTFSLIGDGSMHGRTRLSRSMPSEMGEQYLTRLMERMKTKHPQVTVIDHH